VCESIPVLRGRKLVTDLERRSAAQALVRAAMRVEVEPLRQPLVDIGTVDVVLEIDVLVEHADSRVCRECRRDSAACPVQANQDTPVPMNVVPGTMPWQEAPASLLRFAHSWCREPEVSSMEAAITHGRTH
jgi:hypothetical protein